MLKRLFGVKEEECTVGNHDWVEISRAKLIESSDATEFVVTKEDSVEPKKLVALCSRCNAEQYMYVKQVPQITF